MRRFFLKTCRDYGKEKFGRVTDREGFKEVFVLLEICQGFFSPKYSQKWSPLLCSINNVVPS